MTIPPVVSVGLSGCTASDDTGSTETPSSTDAPTNTSPPTPRGPISVDVRNETTSARTVHLTIAKGDTTILEESVDLPAENRVEVDTGISTTGTFELDVSVSDGPRERTEFTIEEYDLQMGSDLVVMIREDGIRVLIQE